jgi:hypothetical protein
MSGLALALQEKLRHDPRTNIARYAEHVPQCIPAAVDCMVNGAPYSELPGHGSLEIPPITLTKGPVFWNTNDLTPPPNPDIAWWWDRLDT